MSLKEKLEKLKRLNEENQESDWITYKEVWKKAVSELEGLIMYKWFNDYQENGLMTFATIPVTRVEPYIGEYITTKLEITLPPNKYLVLEPVSAVTAEYDGKLEFYMLGNIYKKATIIRKIVGNNQHEWLIAKSHDPKDHHKLTKSELEKLIDEWLQ